MKVLKFCTWFFLITIVATSCSRIKDPDFRSIESVEIADLSTQRISFDCDLIFYNPNSFALDLDRAEIEILVDSIDIGQVKQTYNSLMPGKDNFNMPVFIDLDISKLYKGDALGAITRGLKIVKSRELEIHLKGNIYVGKGDIKIPVPVNRVTLVEF